MFFRSSLSKVHHPLPGAVRRQVALGGSLQIISFQFEKGALVPQHCHPNEQVGMVVSGRIVFDMAGERCELGPGDGYSIPPGVEHSAEIIEDAVIIDVFSPPRDDYRDR